MKIILTTMFFSLSSSLNYVLAYEPKFEETDAMPPLAGVSSVKLLIEMVAAFYILNSARILLDPESGNKIKGFMKVVFGLLVLITVIQMI